MASVIHLDEQVKLPYKFTHYFEHKALHPHDSIVAFLYKHYVLNQNAESEKDKKNDAGQSRHSNL